MIYNLKHYKNSATINVVVATLITLLIGFEIRNAEGQSTINYLDGETVITSRNQVKSDGLFFGPQLYRSYAKNEKIYINDQKFCFTAIVDKDFQVTTTRDDRNLNFIDECHHSIWQKQNTTFIYYHLSSRIAKIVDNDIEKVIKIDWPDSIIGINRYTSFSVLDNGNFIIPIGQNIMTAPEHYKANLGMTNLKNYNLNQSLFALYDSSGTFITEFGHFPSVFGIENLTYASPKSYFYSIGKETIYVSYPISNKIEEFNFMGEKIDSYEINLPNFKYQEEYHEGWIDTISGFATYEDSEKGVGFYFYTFQHDGRQVNTILHHLNKNNNSIISGVIQDKLNNGMLLQNGTYSGVQYLTMPWDEKPVEIVDISLN